MILRFWFFFFFFAYSLYLQVLNAIFYMYNGLHNNLHYWTMISDKFGSQLGWQSKTWVFTFLNVYVSWIKRDKILILQLSPSKFRYFADQNRPKGEPHENKFWHSSNTKMNITNKWKKWGHLSSFLFFLPQLWSSNCQK